MNKTCNSLTLIKIYTKKKYISDFVIHANAYILYTHTKKNKKKIREHKGMIKCVERQTAINEE